VFDFFFFEVNYYLLEDYSFEGTLRTLELASHFHKTCLKYKSIIDENGTIFDTVQSQNYVASLNFIIENLSIQII